MLNTTLILLALFCQSEGLYASPLVEESFDAITFIKVQHYQPSPTEMFKLSTSAYRGTYYDERVYFWRANKPAAVLYRPMEKMVSISCDEISPYLYWYDELGEIWIRPSEGKRGRWLTTGIWRKARCNDIRFEYHSTKPTKLEDLLGIEEIRINMPQVPFGSDFKILEVEEKDLWERK